MGNRWTLAGAVIYLLEWVAIIGVRTGQAPPPGSNTDAIVHNLSAFATGYAVSAGWFGLVLPGRILFIAGLRQAIRLSKSESVLADLALAMMAMSVILEVASYGLVAAAAQVAARGGDAGAVVALHAAGFWINFLIVTPFGVAIAAAPAAQLATGLFPSWLAWLGLVSGIIGALVGVVALPAIDVGGTLRQAVMLGSTVILGAWVWMLVTGVILWRRMPAA